MFTRTWSFALLLGILTLALSEAPNLHGQANLGSITGTVTDSSGAGVPNVPVTARAKSTGAERRTLASAEGVYLLTALPIGEYEIRVEGSGFKTAVLESVRVISSVTTTQDISLDLGTTTESVVVSASATVVDTTATSLGTGRVVEEIKELPLLMVGNQRSTVSLVRTLPGVNWETSVLDDGSQGINVASIYGTPEGGASYQIDGIMASVSGWGQLRDDFAPPPEMIEEMRLTTNTSSEFGGQNSGVSVSLVFKSGTNSLHGALYEYLRNDALDARNFYAPYVTPNKQNEWGFVLGGPVVIPHVYNGKDRTFFFGMYSGFRLRNTPAGVQASVPTAAMRAGNFSELLGAQMGTDALSRPIFRGAIYDPATTRTVTQGVVDPVSGLRATSSGTIRDPFNYQGRLNVMDPAAISSISNFFQQGYPLPTLPGVASNWVGSPAASPVDADKGSIKIDHLMSGGKQRIMGTYQQWHRIITLGGLFDPRIASTSVIDSPTWIARATYQWTPSANVVFNLRTAVNHCSDRLGSWPFPADTYGAQSGLTGVFYPAVPPVTITSMTGFGTNFGGTIHNPNWMVPVNSDVSWAKGRHNLKFGFQYAAQTFIEDTDRNGTGTYNYNQNETALPGAPAGTGFGYASYLLGVVDNATLATPVHTRYGSSIFGFYAQDEWRVTPKLTMSYGVRWDVTLPGREQYDRFSSFSKSVPNPAAGGILGALTFWGDGPGRNGLKRQASIYWREVSPRLGLAYALNSKTIIRASYGLSSPAFTGTAGRGISVSGQGNINVSPASLDGGVTPAFDWDAGFPSSAIPPLPSLNPSLLNGFNVTWDVVDDVRPSRTQNLSFGIEREIPGGILVRGSYIGNWTHGLAVNGYNINQIDLAHLSLGPLLQQSVTSPAAQAAGIVVPYPGFTGSVGQALRPYPQFGNVTQGLRPTGYNIYNGGEFTLQKHTGHGLSFLLSYVVSKNMVNHARLNGQGRSNLILQHYSQLREAKMISELDRPQNLALSYIYELPFGPGKRFANNSNPIIKHLAGGWQVAGVHTYFSGFPLNITTNQTVVGGFGSIWPNSVPGVPIELNKCGDIDPSDPVTKYRLNIAAFSVPAPFSLGNYRNVGNVRQCGYFNENFSVMKRFRIGERVSILFAAEASNVLNRHIWQNMGLNISVPSTFGTSGAVNFGSGSSGATIISNGASDPRLIQFKLKVEF